MLVAWVRLDRQLVGPLRAAGWQQRQRGLLAFGLAAMACTAHALQVDLVGGVGAADAEARHIDDVVDLGSDTA